MRRSRIHRRFASNQQLFRKDGKIIDQKPLLGSSSFLLEHAKKGRYTLYGK